LPPVLPGDLGLDSKQECIPVSLSSKLRTSPATEFDPQKREAILHRIQQLIYEKAMYVPIMEVAVLNGYGPRVAESGLGLITNMAATAPYEDLMLKAK